MKARFALIRRSAALRWLIPAFGLLLLVNVEWLTVAHGDGAGLGHADIVPSVDQARVTAEALPHPRRPASAWVALAPPKPTPPLIEPASGATPESDYPGFSAVYAGALRYSGQPLPLYQSSARTGELQRALSLNRRSFTTASARTAPSAGGDGRSVQSAGSTTAAPSGRGTPGAAADIDPAETLTPGDLSPVVTLPAADASPDLHDDISGLPVDTGGPAASTPGLPLQGAPPLPATTPVDEPASLPMIGAGFVTLFIRRYRSR